MHRQRLQNIIINLKYGRRQYYNHLWFLIFKDKEQLYRKLEIQEQTGDWMID